MEQRKQEIVFMNVLLCLLVVFIHVSSSPVTTLQKDSLAYIFVMFPWRLSAFVVQGFIFLAALKVFLKDPIKDYKAYYISRFKTIVIPYILWVTVYYIYFCQKEYFPFNMSDLGQYILIGNLVSPFYFIIIIIQFYALMPIWQKVYRNVNPFLAIVFSLAITIAFKELFVKILYSISGYSFPYADRILFGYLIFWSLGAVCGLYYSSLVKFLKEKLFIILFIFIVFSCLNLHYTYQSMVFNEHFSFLENLHLFYCILAIGATMSIGLFVKENRILNKLNGITYYVYLSHCFVMFIVNEEILKPGVTSISQSYILRFIGVYSITILMCLIYTKIKFAFQKRLL